MFLCHVPVKSYKECTLIRDQEILLAIVCFQLLQIVFSEATMVRSQHFAVS